MAREREVRNARRVRGVCGRKSRRVEQLNEGSGGRDERSWNCDPRQKIAKGAVHLNERSGVARVKINEKNDGLSNKRCAHLRSTPTLRNGSLLNLRAGCAKCTTCRMAN